MILSKEINDDSLLKVSSIDYGLESYYKNDTSGIKEAYHNLGFLYNRNNDSTALAKEYHYKALKFRRQFKLDSSFYYYYQSKRISELIKDSIQTGRRLLSMGLMQKNENDLVGAEASLIEGLSFLEPKNEFRFTASTHNNLGLTLIRFGRFDEARSSFENALELHKKNEHQNSRERGFLDYYNNVGFSYIKERKFKKAFNSLNKGLNLKTQINHLGAYQALLGNLADCLFQSGKRSEGWSKLFELLKSREETKDVYGLSMSHNGIAYYYEGEGNKQKALYHAEKAHEYAKQSNNNLTRLSALSKLVKLSSGEKSRQYFEEYETLNETLLNRERSVKDQFAKVRYETVKKEKRNKELLLESERQRQQKIIGWLFSFAVLLVLGFSFMAFRARRKKLMYEAQIQKATAREEERQQIAKSLHDEVAGDLRMLHQKLSKTELQGEAKSVEKIKDNVRNLSHQLSSVSFEEVSFKDQLINLISDNFSMDFRISTQGIDSVSWEEVNNTIKRTLYLSIRESLQNTLKYAEANKFFIQFSSEKKEILLLLKDNGKGFEKGKGKKGIGLKNLKERVEEIHGTFQINSSEEGTQTTISIPINGR